MKLLFVAYDDFPDTVVQRVRERTDDLFLSTSLFVREATPAVERSGDQVYAEDYIRDVQEHVKQQRCEYGIGFTEEDLTVPMYSYVFGYALFSAHAAVVSNARLHHHDRLYDRTLKETFHQLGHLLGLPHHTCVMQFANSISAVDKKPTGFCERCVQHLYNKNISYRPLP